MDSTIFNNLYWVVYKLYCVGYELFVGWDRSTSKLPCFILFLLTATHEVWPCIGSWWRVDSPNIRGWSGRNGPGCRCWSRRTWGGVFVCNWRMARNRLSAMRSLAGRCGKFLDFGDIYKWDEMICYNVCRVVIIDINWSWYISIARLCYIIKY